MFKCPKCNQMATDLNGCSTTIHIGNSKWNGLAYTCRSCHSIVSAQIDPTIIREEIIQRVVDELFQKLRK